MTHLPTPLTNADLPDALALNNAAVPHVNVLDLAALDRLRALSAVAVACRNADGGLAGFMLALPPGLDHDSPNYRWGCANRSHLIYVDRIVVAPDARGLGIGRALYDPVIEAARREGHGRVLCEVNERPPNPGSLAFHKALGFREIGRADYGPGDKAVVFLEHIAT
jgi:predicted GNAT superfamily acetyltransferase